MTTNEEIFTGIKYDINPLDLVTTHIESYTIEDDGRGATGSVSGNDMYFSDNMVTASNSLDNILKKMAGE